MDKKKQTVTLRIGTKLIKPWISINCNLKTLIFLLSWLASTSVFSQNITNTLGVGGQFIIEDATTNFLTLSQSTGQVNILKNLRLENTASSSVGVIFKNIDRFIHNYGSYNTFIGVNSGNLTMTGQSNSGLGRRSLYSNTTGDNNTAIGYNSLYNNTTGNSNTAIGILSLYSNTVGDSNSANGRSSLYSNTTGSGNTAFGTGSLWSNVGNHGSTAVGYQAMYFADTRTTGRMTYNTALGYWALRGSPTAEDNDGQYNTASGHGALYSNTGGDFNTANGYHALYYNTTAPRNTANGSLALYRNTTGYDNSAAGSGALYYNQTGHENTATGSGALHDNTSGSYNTANGFWALYNNSMGDYNTALGYDAGTSINTGSNLTCLGNNAEPTSSSATNQITLGNNQITSLRCNVTTITALSDARDKKNIKDLGLGIDFLMKLKPRIYNWDKREWYDNNISDGSKMKEEPTAGFIAQELDEVQTTAEAEWLNLVLKDNPEKWEATPGNLLPIMVKAIQDLKAENVQLKNQLTELAEIKEQIAEIENLKAELKEQIEILKASNNSEKINFSFINKERIEK